MSLRRRDVDEMGECRGLKGDSEVKFVYDPV